MSCNFNVKKCINCQKYNGCLLQTIYSNMNKMSNVVDTIIQNQKILEQSIDEINNSTQTNDLNILNQKVDSLNNTVKTITQKNQTYDIETITSSLTTLELKVDTLLKSTNLLINGGL